MDVRRILAGLAAVPLVLLAVLLGACGSGGTSVADPPVSSAPTTSHPTTKPQHETAEHFIRRWVQEDTRIQATGDTARFRSMSKGCRGCTKLANLVDRIYSAGGFVHTKGWRVTNISLVGIQSGSKTADLFVFSAATMYARSKDSPTQHLASGKAHFQLGLKATSRSWIVSSLVQIAS
jgi:hypothetical protein